MADPSAASGIYWIDPNGGDPSDAFQAYCDMTTDGGGWTLGLVGRAGAILQSNEVTSLEGTAGASSPHRVNLTHLAIDQQAQIRHELVRGSVVFDGYYQGRYHDPMATQGQWTILDGNPALMQGSYGQPWRPHPQYGNTYQGRDIRWYYSAAAPYYGAVPSAPWYGTPGPLSTGIGPLDMYRIFVREVEYTPPPPEPAVFWITTFSGNWDDGWNWTFALPPDPTDDVRIQPEDGLIVDGPAAATEIGSLTIGAISSGVAELRLPADLTSPSGVTVESAGRITLLGAVLDAGAGLAIDGAGEVTGAGVIIGSTGGTTGEAGLSPSGNLIRSTPLALGSRSAKVLSRGFANLGPNTTFSGATINVPNGLFLQGAGNLEGHGTLGGRVAAAFGSKIIADGTLTLGDSDSYAGFTSDGELYVGTHTVTIHDKNEAVLGSLTTLGSAGSPGVLEAANGLLVEFGKNVTGFGTIDTPNDPSKPLINNGLILGESMGEPITLNGYVKGVGSLGNVVIAGTVSPGFSPGRLPATDVAFAETATLVMEIGGLSPGSEHDVLELSGTAALDGTLELRLINGFVPEVGDEFTILTFGSVVDDFAAYQGLGLGGGLRLEPELTGKSLKLTAVPEPDTLLLFGAAVAMLAWGSRRGTRRSMQAARLFGRSMG